MERIVLVEDNLLFRESLALLLQWRTGLSSVHAGSLTEARGILDDTSQKLACVVVDLDLPEGEGIEVLKQLSGLPVVALSSSLDPERQAEAIGLGRDQVLGTTGSVEKIVAVVERLIGQRSITVF
jgi:DNA-binding NarL/FixJ family response regulator